jgi:hypothetical protein
LTTQAPKRTIRVNRRVESDGIRYQIQTARLVASALALIRDELDERAPYVGGGDSSTPRVSGGGRTVHVDADEHGDAEDVPVSSVEAAVFRADLVRDRQQEIYDRIDGIRIAIRSLDRFCRTIIGDDKAVPALCDGVARHYQGHEITWVPNSHDPQGGWMDPLCRDIAGKHGICDRCLTRMNRWRARNDLPLIGIEKAA